ncbi:hypothetical protein GC209_18655 [bacterium]|nr:hypothetical protein [bacterium]
MRMELSGRWVIGPALGAWIAESFRVRTMLWATAACFVLQRVPMQGVTNRSGARPDRAAPSLPFRAYLPLAVFTALYVLLYAGQPINYGFR